MPALAALAMAILPTLSVALVLVGGPGAAAADDDAIVQFEGTMSSQSTTGEPYGTFPVTATVDCSSDPCLLVQTITFPQGPLTTPQVPLIDGVGAYDEPGSGGPCTVWWAPGPWTFSVVGDTLTGAFASRIAGSYECEGGAITYTDFLWSVVATAVTGESCQVTDSCPTPTPTATAVAVPVADGPAPAAGGVAEPGTLSTLRTLADAATPANGLWAAALTVVLVLLIAVPTHLFNSAIETASARFGAWRRARGRAASAPRRNAWVFVGAGVLAAALLSSFVDPGFGVTAESPRVFLSVLASFVIDIVVGWFVVIWLVRRTHPGAAVTVTFVPATLLIVIAAVVFSRLTGFEPGIVFGLVAGITFGSLIAVADRARVALLTLGYSFVVGIAGWVGYSVLATADPTPAGVFVQETLAALAIAGIAALPIALVPIKGLTGHTVYTWNRRVWIGAYATGLFAFMFVLMPVPFSWQAVSLSFWTWAGIYAAYALGAVGLWLVIERPWAKSDGGRVDGPAEATVAGGVDGDRLP